MLWCGLLSSSCGELFGGVWAFGPYLQAFSPSKQVRNCTDSSEILPSFCRYLNNSNQSSIAWVIAFWTVPFLCMNYMCAIFFGIVTKQCIWASGRKQTPSNIESLRASFFFHFLFGLTLWSWIVISCWAQFDI